MDAHAYFGIDVRASLVKCGATPASNRRRLQSTCLTTAFAARWHDDFPLKPWLQYIEAQVGKARKCEMRTLDAVRRRLSPARRRRKDGK